jgi:hypothetical protein
MFPPPKAEEGLSS